MRAPHCYRYPANRFNNENQLGYYQAPQETFNANGIKKSEPVFANNAELQQAPNNQSGRFGTRNQFTGVVTRVVKGETSAFVEIDIGGNNTVTALVNLLPLEDLGIQLGSTVTAIFQPADVILYSYGSMD